MNAGRINLKHVLLNDFVHMTKCLFQQCVFLIIIISAIAFYLSVLLRLIYWCGHNKGYDIFTFLKLKLKKLFVIEYHFLVLSFIVNVVKHLF